MPCPPSPPLLPNSRACCPQKAEAVCRHYLSNGRRCGHYWIVGDVGNTPGRSLYVRLRGPSSGKGAAGKWCDAATGEHGDLLDLIRLNCGFESLRETLDEARSFLSVPRPEPAAENATRAGPAQRVPSRKTSLRDRTTGHRHAGGGLSARARDHRAARRTLEPAVPSRLLLPRHGRGATRDLARAPRRDHRRAAAASPPCSGPGSLATDRARRRSRTRVARSGTSSGPACASGSSMTSSRSAKASRPCCRSGASSLGCRCSRGSRPTTSPPWSCPSGSGASTSRATTIAEGRRAEARLRERVRTAGRRGLPFAAGLCGLQRRSAPLRTWGSASSGLHASSSRRIGNASLCAAS